MSRFAEYLSAFSKSGSRYDNTLRLVMSGKALGMSAEDIVERAHSVGVTSRDGDIRRLWNGSKVQPEDRAYRGYVRRTRPAEPPVEPISKCMRDFVPVTLRERGHDSVIAAAFGELIRMDDAYLKLDEAAYRRQAARQLRALHHGSKVWAGTIVGDEDARSRLRIARAKTPITPGPGSNVFDPSVRAGIVLADDLAERIERGGLARLPTHISLNAVTGQPGATGDGGSSYDCAGTVAEYHHVLIEWDALKGADGMPSQDQIDIVAGLADYAMELGSFHVVCIVYTGGKSLHTVLRVPASGVDDYRRSCADLADLFASADDARFRIDVSGWNSGRAANAATHVRLAGAVRPETGRRQRIIWCDE